MEESLGQWPCWLKVSETSSCLLRKQLIKFRRIPEEETSRCVIVLGCCGKTEHKMSTMIKKTTIKSKMLQVLLTELGNSAGSASTKCPGWKTTFPFDSQEDKCAVAVVTGDGGVSHTDTFSPCRRERWGLSCVFHRATVDHPADWGRTPESPPYRSLPTVITETEVEPEVNVYVYSFPLQMYWLVKNKQLWSCEYATSAMNKLCVCWQLTDLCPGCSGCCWLDPNWDCGGWRCETEKRTRWSRWCFFGHPAHWWDRGTGCRTQSADTGIYGQTLKICWT